jgi:hypothetical protein
MLFDGPNGKTLVSEEFNQMCVNNQVECSVQARPNPGNPYRAMRMLTFRSFSDSTIRVYQFDEKKQVHEIPAFGSIQVMLMTPDEPLPRIEKVDNG